MGGALLSAYSAHNLVPWCTAGDTVYFDRHCCHQVVVHCCVVHMLRSAHAVWHRYPTACGPHSASSQSLAQCGGPWNAFNRLNKSYKRIFEQGYVRQCSTCFDYIALLHVTHGMKTPQVIASNWWQCLCSDKLWPENCMLVEEGLGPVVSCLMKSATTWLEDNVTLFGIDQSEG